MEGAGLQKKIGYRNDVDGLRAIAVLLVLLFHLNVSGFSGGFVGVDIFYVISGFVIFRSMILEREDDRFSIGGFYSRRIRRIFPALAFTVVLSIVAGFFVLIPSEYESLSYSALAAVFSVSNIYFNDRLGYFADSVESTPLIHTWSLGVEEQFYLIAPVVLLALTRYLGSKGLFRGLLSLCAISFLYNLFAVYGLTNENHAFYLPMSRFWEIGVGGVVACLERRVQVRGSLSVLLIVLGLLGMAASAALIDNNMAFPAFTALLPVGSTALLILAAPPPASLAYRLLACRPMLFFGKISYSLYLFHWPVIVYFGLYVGRDFTAVEKTALFLVTTGLAAFSWKFVEAPFRAARDGEQWRRAKRTAAAATVSILILCGVVIVSEGLPFRLRPQALELALHIEAPEIPETRCMPVARLNVVPKANVCSYFYDEDRIDFLLWGDSHAAMLASPLSSRLHDVGWNGLRAVMADCPPLIGVYSSKRKNRAECGELAAHIENVVKNESVTVVLLASRWANLASNQRSPGDGGLSKRLFDAEAGGASIGFERALARTVERITMAGARVVIVGPVPELDFSLPDMLIRTANWGRPLPEASRGTFDTRQEIVLPALERISLRPDVAVVYPHELLCDARRCMLVKENKPLYADDDHLTTAGVSLILPPVLNAVTGREGVQRNASVGN